MHKRVSQMLHINAARIAKDNKLKDAVKELFDALVRTGVEQVQLEMRGEGLFRAAVMVKDAAVWLEREHGEALLRFDVSMADDTVCYIARATTTHSEVRMGAVVSAVEHALNVVDTYLYR